jgi:hypothetical protein
MCLLFGETYTSILTRKKQQPQQGDTGAAKEYVPNYPISSNFNRLKIQLVYGKSVSVFSKILGRTKSYMTL